ncbi:MAG: HlyD family efflux transporter periplasmic adaptor subunit [Gammaproteobacteria bacterium]|nr:HlyD family efflux transporter periplasmic adaptor subunit [Gammaproteobacteria bacterium]
MLVTESVLNSWSAMLHQLIGGLRVVYIDLRGGGVHNGALLFTYPHDAHRHDDWALATRLALSADQPVTSGGTDDDGRSGLRIAYPLHIGAQANGAVLVELDAPLERQAAVLQMLQWGEAWLSLALRQHADDSPLAGLVPLLDEAAGHADYADARTAMLARLPALCGATRVALGQVRGDRVVLEAVSDVTMPDSRAQHVRAVTAAMQEAYDAGVMLSVPGPSTNADDEPARIASPQHEALRTEAGLAAACSVPLQRGLPFAMVLCFEFSSVRDWGSGSRQACEQVARLAAPLLALRHEIDRPWRQRLRGLLVDGAATLQARMRRAGALTALAVTVLALSFALSRGDYRVSATASIEGEVQRAIVAPFDGYVAAAEVRAGQRVRTGTVLARLDDRELKGERRGLLAEETELVENHRQAVAALDHAKSKILDAQLAQTRARLGLLDERLARTELTAPFDGVVISGDWSRSLGVPVTRGDLMFEIAPLDAYRVALQVNDRDIAALAPGQQGSLTLTALPRQPVRFELTDVSSLADEQVSEPMFRVEADLWDNPPALRPGMQGIAKVHAGQRQRWWIWTHALTDWLQLQWWHWRP